MSDYSNIIAESISSYSVISSTGYNNLAIGKFYKFTPNSYSNNLVIGYNSNIQTRKVIFEKKLYPLITSHSTTLSYSTIILSTII